MVQECEQKKGPRMTERRQRVSEQTPSGGVPVPPSAAHCHVPDTQPGSREQSLPKAHHQVEPDKPPSPYFFVAAPCGWSHTKVLNRCQKVFLFFAFIYLTVDIGSKRQGKNYP